MSAFYGIAGVGVAGLMRAGYCATQVIVEVGPYWVPAVAGIMRAGLSHAGDDTGGSTRYYVEDLQVTQTGAGEVSEAAFTLTVHQDATQPQDGNPVVIGVGTTRNRLFGGYLRVPSRDYLTPEYRTYTCRAVSWEMDLERRLLNASWSSQPAGTLLQSLLATYAPYFNAVAYVDAGTTLDAFTARDESLLAICKRLAELSNYVFYVDPLRFVHFHRAERLTAPWSVVTGQRYGSLKTAEDSGQLKNKIIVYYSQLQSQVETFTGNGTQKDFQLGFVPHAVTALTVNGAAVTYATANAPDIATQDFALDYTRGIIQTKAHATLTGGDTLAISYTAKVPAKLTRHHRAAQADRAQREGGDGIYEYVIRGEQTILGLPDARAAADAELARDAYPRHSANYIRTEPLFDLLRLRLMPGMTQRVVDWDIDEEMTIRKVTISVLVPSNSATLRWLQAVELGPAQSTLENIVRTAIAPQTATAAVAIGIDTEENYE